MKSLMHLIEEPRRIPVDVIERNVDLENLLAISHLGGAFDPYLPRKPSGHMAARLLFDLSKARAESVLVERALSPIGLTSYLRSLVSMPHADNTEATPGTITRGIS